MGVGVRIVSKNLNPKPGLAGEGKPLWRQETMTETLSAGRLSTRGARSSRASRLDDQARKARRARGGVVFGRGGAGSES